MINPAVGNERRDVELFEIVFEELIFHSKSWRDFSNSFLVAALFRNNKFKEVQLNKNNKTLLSLNQIPHGGGVTLLSFL